MKLLRFVAGALIVFSLSACKSGGGADVQGPPRPAADHGTAGHQLPASLDNFYPPKAEGPVYLFAMFELAAPLDGLVGDLQQGDMPGVTSNFEAFKAEYAKVSQMIPEWADRFPREPVEGLGAALASQDPAQVMPAVQKVGEACAACHHRYVPLTQFKYHWPDFSEVTVIDPTTNQPIPLLQTMQMLGVNFMGIGNDLKQGQKENALAQFAALKARFSNLADACTHCHETPRHYFVDEEAMGLFDKLESAINADPPNPTTVQDLTMAIGMESCMKCHFVHVPAATAQKMWKAR